MSGDDVVYVWRLMTLTFFGMDELFVTMLGSSFLAFSHFVRLCCFFYISVKVRNKFRIYQIIYLGR